MEQTTARLRKTFQYPADNDSDDSSPEALDEEGLSTPSQPHHTSLVVAFSTPFKRHYSNLTSQNKKISSARSKNKIPPSIYSTPASSSLSPSYPSSLIFQRSSTPSPQSYPSSRYPLSSQPPISHSHSCPVEQVCLSSTL